MSNYQIVKLVTYLNLADCNPARITEVDKDFTKKLDFKYIKFLFKVRDIYKIEKILYQDSCFWL